MTLTILSPTAFATLPSLVLPPLTATIALAAAAAAAALLAGAASAYTPADVAAAQARAATPVRADRPVPASAIDPAVVDLAAMWAQATQHDGNTSTDCRAFMLQYEFSLRLLPERAPLRDAFDSLRLLELCGVTPPPSSSAAYSSAYSTHFAPLSRAELAARCSEEPPLYVDAAAGSDVAGSRAAAAAAAAGSRARPFRTFARALAATRAARAERAAAGAARATACIVLRGGVHHLGATQLLTAADSGLVVTAAEGDSQPAWISGGVPLGDLAWQPFNVAAGMNVYVADVSGAGLKSMPGLQTLSAAPGAVPTRLFPAMYPNYDIEFFSGNLPGDGQVSVWRKPPIMAIPTLVYKDLKAAGLKDDSTMREYNIYAAGQGGPCDHWEQPEGMWAYVCSNSTAGGWEEIERGFGGVPSFRQPFPRHCTNKPRTHLLARLLTCSLARSLAHSLTHSPFLLQPAATPARRPTIFCSEHRPAGLPNRRSAQ